jgi:hypothetical protein
MLKFVVRRWWVFGAAALILLVAAISTWALWSTKPWLAVVLGVSIASGGLGVLTFVRVVRAVRELYRDTTQLKKLFAARGEVIEMARSERESIHKRLALAERRLAALAMKLDSTDELGEPPR